MKITIKTLKFDAGEQLTGFVEKKVSRLERFCSGDDAEAVIALENVKEGKIVKLHVSSQGEEFMIERCADTFENAITVCVDAMKEKITRAKERKEDDAQA